MTAAPLMTQASYAVAVHFMFAGAMPDGMSFNCDTLSGTPTMPGFYNFSIQAIDNNGCTGTRAYTVIVSGNGLQFYPLPSPVRALETRAPFSGCVNPGAPINANTSLTLAVRAGCTGIPANATAVTGNVTVVPGVSGGYLTLFPGTVTQPICRQFQFQTGRSHQQRLHDGLGAGDGAFKIFASATTEVIVDITGYYAPPTVNGLYFHPLSEPVRLLETRPDFPGFSLTGCTRTNTPIAGNLNMATHTQMAANFCGLPATAQAVVGNVSVVNTAGAGFLTLFPANLGTAPLVATSNYPVPATFGYNRHYIVGLSPVDGKFKVLTNFTTDLVLDVSGYFAP